MSLNTGNYNQNFIESENEEEIATPMIIVKQVPPIQLEPVQECNWIDEINQNYNVEVATTISMIPILKTYIGCINCGIPLAYESEIHDLIPNSRYSQMVEAIILPVFINSLILFSTEITAHRVHWQTRTGCRNCYIHLSFPTLTIYNQLIDDYCYDDDLCVILDASSIAFYRREPL